MNGENSGKKRKDIEMEQMMLFLVEKHKGYRLDLFNWQSTGGWRADLMNNFAHHETPFGAISTLFYQLGHTLLELQEWIDDDPIVHS